MKISGNRLTILIFVGVTLSATLALGLFGIVPHHHTDGHCPIAAASGNSCPISDTIESALWHVRSIVSLNTGLVSAAVVYALALVMALIAYFNIRILTHAPPLIAPLGLVKARFDAQSGLWRPTMRWLYYGRLTKRDPRASS